MSSDEPKKGIRLFLLLITETLFNFGFVNINLGDGHFVYFFELNRESVSKLLHWHSKTDSKYYKPYSLHLNC